MTGAVAGMNRTRLPGAVRAFVVIAGFTLLVNTVNVFTAIHDAAEHGERLAIWEPAVWESTSGIATLLFCPIAYAAICRTLPRRVPWPMFATLHAGASLVYSSLHILLMNALRVGIYGAIGDHYQFGESGFWYEYRKDLIAYILFAATFWFFTSGPSAPRRDAATFDIRDGSRLLRVRVKEIVALHAAGNYVEFLLIDGRRPLARNSLTEVHRQLGSSDFVRTHRSWVVNLLHVRELRPLGGGDFEVRLEGGSAIPISRRFSDALERLRQPTSSDQ